MIDARWADVINGLRGRPWRVSVRLELWQVPPPALGGLRRARGLPAGQAADYRAALADGSGLHVRDYGSHYTAHLDQVDPSVDWVGHLRADSPRVLFTGLATIGGTVLSLALFLAVRR